MGLRAISWVVPETRVDSETIASWCGLRPELISDKIGIKSRAFLGKNETGLSLAKAACEKLFAENRELRDREVDLLAVVTQNPDHKLPHMSALLQDALGLPTSTASFDISLGCSGYVYALSVVPPFMEAQELDDAIVVTCDPYSKIMRREDSDTVAIFGDGASASWLSRAEGAGFGIADFGTDGSGAKDLIVEGAGGSDPYVGLWRNGSEGISEDDLRLHMNGHAIFRFMMERIPISVHSCLSKNGLEVGDIDYFVFHQASAFLLNALTKQMKLPQEKVPCRLENVGNTVSSTIPIVLAQLREEEKLSGKTVLVSGFGVGLSWATNILTFN